ncbi:MAG: hypothetical protein E7517_03665 [Ruminococcaceae bacterium]|nr:hypothetical protein [Oscillospiraceae bacterium]
MASTWNKKKALEVLSAAAPGYTVSDSTKKEYKNMQNLSKSWNDKINTNINQYNAIGDFDPAKSAMYQKAYNSLKQVYKTQGKQNMQNAIAEAAANTEGYGNSYGTTAGNQAYQQALATLAGKVPELYSMAASEHAAKKSNLAQTIGLQQSQYQTALNDAQYRLSVQQALDEQRYNALVNQDSAKRKRAEWWLKLYGKA